MSAWSKLVTPSARHCSISATRWATLICHSFMRHMPATMRDRRGPPLLVGREGQVGSLVAVMGNFRRDKEIGRAARGGRMLIITISLPPRQGVAASPRRLKFPFVNVYGAGFIV